MKFSYNWIKELVPELSAAPKELERLITMKTAESEGLEETGALLAGACLARVVSAEAIEGTHNQTALVETERYGTKTVVCGAPNCRAGLVTVYVPLGRKTINGIESDGMLASGAELGINRDHHGIIEINGASERALAGCAPDTIIEIDNKSLTHRPDLWGHFGMAREAAAVAGGSLQDPCDFTLLPTGPAPVQIAIEDLDLCPRYSALVVENIKIGPSPLWLQYRLESIGLNPISNVVDATNFVMAELAQPMHAFDADKLQGDTIFIRPARDGETLVALDGETYTLNPANLVIADAGGPIALAGVIGGLHSSITESTTRIVLESANFQAANIRKTSTRLKIRTDASMRYEKAQDPINTVRGLARAVALLHDVSPGIRIAGGVVEQKKEIPAPAPITLPMDWLLRKLGCVVTQAEVVRILTALDFSVAETAPGVLSVRVPSWRATKDVSIKEDLVEEVGRMIGYDNIVPAAPLLPVTTPPPSPERLFHRSVRALVAAQGFNEVYNYSFLSEDAVRDFDWTPEQHVRVANPISSEQGLMRLSLLPGIRKNVLDNSKHSDDFRLFEIGREIHKRPEGLPEEITHLAAAVYSRSGDGEAGAPGLFELKRVVECLMPGAELAPAAARPFEHPARAAEVLWRGETLGRLFEFHPAMVEGRCAVLDIDLDAMRRMQPETAKYKPVQRFPSSSFDLSVIIGLREHLGGIEKMLRGFVGGPLESLVFLRQYIGPQIPEGKQSVSFRLTVAAPDRTLSSEEVGTIRARIIDGMQTAGYELRV